MYVGALQQKVWHSCTVNQESGIVDQIANEFVPTVYKETPSTSIIPNNILYPPLSSVSTNNDNIKIPEIPAWFEGEKERLKKKIKSLNV